MMNYSIFCEKSSCYEEPERRLRGSLQAEEWLPVPFITKKRKGEHETIFRQRREAKCTCFNVFAQTLNVD